MATQENLAIFIKLSFPLQHDPADYLRYYPREIKTLDHTNTCEWIFIEVIHNCQKLEIIKTSLNEWLDKQSLLQQSNRVFLSNKKEWAKTLCLVRETGLIIIYTVCMASFMWHSGKSKTIRTEKRSVVTRG